MNNYLFISKFLFSRIFNRTRPSRTCFLKRFQDLNLLGCLKSLCPWWFPPVALNANKAQAIFMVGLPFWHKSFRRRSFQSRLGMVGYPNFISGIPWFWWIPLGFWNPQYCWEPKQKEVHCIADSQAQYVGFGPQ